jgi:hypothetical protein
MVSMRSAALLALAILAVTCGPSPNAKLPGFVTTTGGTKGAGGVTESGGTVGSGGRTTVGSGGTTVVGSGGTTARGTGGVDGTGGRTTGTGGRTTGAGGRTFGSDGGLGTGGTTIQGTGGSGTGGRTKADAGRGGSGGTSDAGRDVGVADTRGTGGSTGAGGTTGGRDVAAPPSDSAGNCVSKVVSNGYACGSTPACSACKENSNSREAECKKGIDCLAEAGPSCDSKCQLNCLNLAGDSVIQACVTALQTAACTSGGC